MLLLRVVSYPRFWLGKKRQSEGLVILVQQRETEEILATSVYTWSQKVWLYEYNYSLDCIFF